MSEQDRTDAPDGRPGVMDAARRRIHPFTARASLALRVALLTTGAVAAVLAVASATVYITVRAELEDSLDASLIKRADAAVAAGYSPSTMSTADTDLLAVFGIRFISVEGGRIFTRQTQTNVPFDEREIQVSLGEEKTSQRTARIAGVPYRIVAVQAGPGQALVLAQSMESTQRSLERLKVILLLTSAVGILVAGVAGWVVATNGLRPVRRLTAATERVARTAQLEPIEVTGSEHDELARLTSSFNQMMLALDASQQRQRQLVADAGHELRTPLTSLRTNIELLGQATERSDRELSIEQRREIMDDVRAQLGELTTLVGDLVALGRHRRGARARAGRDQPARQRGEVEPRGRDGHRATARRRPHGPRRGSRHRRGGPAARLRAVLPLHRGAHDARLGPRAVDRAPGRRAPRRVGARGVAPVGRHGRHLRAAGGGRLPRLSHTDWRARTDAGFFRASHVPLSGVSAIGENVVP